MVNHVDTSGEAKIFRKQEAIFRLRVVLLFTNLDFFLIAVGFFLTMSREYFWNKLESVHFKWVYISDLPALGYI